MYEIQYQDGNSSWHHLEYCETLMEANNELLILRQNTPVNYRLVRLVADLE